MPMVEVKDRQHRPEREAAECLLLRDIASSIRRIDPAAPEKMQGGIRLRIEGVEIPTDVVIVLDVRLRDPAQGRAKNSDSEDLCRLIPLQSDQTAWVGVADGSYDLSVRKNGWKFTNTARLPFCQSLQLSTESGRNLQVHGDTQTVVVKAWLAP
jgi:hypothetical protein